MPPAPWTSQEPVSPGQAYARWREHRMRFEETGQWPLILSDPEAYVPRLLAEGEDPQDSLAGAGALDAAALLRRRAGRLPESDEGLIGNFEPTPHPSVEEMIDSFVGSTAWIVLVTCGTPAEALASVYPLGGDSAPNPASHVAVLRHWGERHGAEPVLVADDRLALLVRPVTNLTEAHRAAREWTGYAPDGAGDPNAIAPHLIGLPVWPFWWD